MKKVLIAVSAFLFALSLFSAGNAFAESVKGKGKIKALDAAKGTIVFCPSGTKDEVNVNVDPADLKKLAVGDVVLLQYDKGDVNTATRIKKLKAIDIPVGC